jgi:hypothetical protein
VRIDLLFHWLSHLCYSVVATFSLAEWIQAIHPLPRQPGDQIHYHRYPIISLWKKETKSPAHGAGKGKKGRPNEAKDPASCSEKSKARLQAKLPASFQPNQKTLSISIFITFVRLASPACGYITLQDDCSARTHLESTYLLVAYLARNQEPGARSQEKRNSTSSSSHHKFLTTAARYPAHPTTAVASSHPPSPPPPALITALIQRPPSLQPRFISFHLRPSAPPVGSGPHFHFPTLHFHLC